MTYRLAQNARWASLFWPDGHPHNPDVAALLLRVEGIPGVRRHPKAIDIPYTAYGLPDVFGLLCLTLSDAWPKNKDPEVPPLVPLARASYAHQEDAARKALSSGCQLLADDMGLGKSMTAILAARSATADNPNAKWLILAPLFTRAGWIAELQACGIIESAADVCVLEGKKANPALWRADARVYFCHYDVIDGWFLQFGTSPPAVVIADEGHNLRNSRAKRSRGAALAMGPAKSLRMVLTGTPMENRPSDLWHLLELVCGRGTFGNVGDFRKRYCGAVQGEWGLEDTGPTNLTELQHRMEPFYVRREVKDVGLDLPDLTRTPVMVPLDGKRRASHAQAVEELDMRELMECVQHGRSFGERTLEVLHRLRTLTSEHKLGATQALVTNMLEQGESVVVFAWRRYIVEKLMSLCSVVGVPAYLVHGDENQDVRDERVKAFQEGGGAIFATYGALKEGVTLHRARHIVLHDLDWGPSSLAQAEKRIHRIGQKRACTSHWMMCSGSIDTLFASIVQIKLRNNAEVLGIDHGFDSIISQVASNMMDLPDMAREALEAWHSWK